MAFALPTAREDHWWFIGNNRNLYALTELENDNDMRSMSAPRQTSMGLKMSIAIVSAVLAFTTSTATAGLIDLGNHTRDTDQGLDFLDFSFSIGRTFDDVSGEFGAGGDFAGYRYASKAEVILLINNYGFSPAVTSGVVTGNTGMDQLSGLVDLLGETTIPTSERISRGLTGDTLAGGALVDRVNLIDTIDPFKNDIVDADSLVGPSDIDPNSASWLVRTSPVPEPTSIALFGFGVLGLLGYGVLRKERSQKPARI